MAGALVLLAFILAALRGSGVWNVIREAVWVNLFPAVALTPGSWSLNLLGADFRELLDPRLRVQ